MTTGDIIKTLRISKGMSQEELGNKIGVQKAAINKYENGTVVNLKRSTIAALSEALDVSPLYLLGYDVPPVAQPTQVLSATEETLVGKFRSLNTEGQSKVISYTDDLLRAGIYKNIPAPDSVSKNA